ncbi:MAG: response regulator [Deltaproteobacteria bacterium]|nr:response regulator [Deltaproteobacteria bacterium]
MKILVVDDERLVLKGCQRVLEASNFQVLTAPSVEEALRVVEREAPSVLLVDVKMPGRDGMSLMQEIRAKGLRIPAIVMSGYGTTETIETAMKMGAASFVSKPFTPDEILRAIRGVLAKEEDHDE